MRRVRAALLRFAVFAGYFLHRAGEPLKVTQDYPVQRHFAHGAPGEHGGTGSTAGAEEGAGGESGMLDVFLKGLAGDGIKSNGAALVAFLVQADGGLAVFEVTSMEEPGARRGGKRGPEVSPACWMYSSRAWPATGLSPMVRRLRNTSSMPD